MGSMIDLVHPAQFGDHISQGDEGDASPPGEAKYTPTYSSMHMAPGRSAYGSTHPADIALGKAYRRRSMAAVARGEMTSHSSIATMAQSIIQSGKMPLGQGVSSG